MEAIVSQYFSDMAESAVLQKEEELDVGARISTAERAIFDALVASPAGVRGLIALGLDLESGSADAIATMRLDRVVVEALVAGVRAASHGADVTPLDALALQAIGAAEAEIGRARRRLVTGNLRLVVLFARRYLGRGIALLDLVQEGNLGLLRAAEKFDHRLGFRFSTYAAWWIKQSLQRALLDRTIRLPSGVVHAQRRVARLQTVFMTLHQREPSVEEIAARSGLARERVETVLSLPTQPSSLDLEVGDGGGARLVDLVASSAPPADETAGVHALVPQVEALLSSLDERERRILRLRFGLDHPHEHTLPELGKIFHLTRERVRQIEQGALAKLRPLAGARELRPSAEA